MSKSATTGYVYILINPSFKDNWVKIGKTYNIDQRLSQLDNTSTPLPFVPYAWLKTKWYNEIESKLHKNLDLLTNFRIRQNREFFNIAPELALSLLKNECLTLEDAELWINPDLAEVVKVRPTHVHVSTDTASTAHGEELEDKVVPVTNWLIPGNSKTFDYAACVAKYGGIYWRSRNHFKEGDIVYMYSAGDDKRITFKFKVTEANLAYSEKVDAMDEFWLNGHKESDDKVTPCHFFELVSTETSGKLTFHALKEQGLAGTLQCARSLTGNLLSFVEQNFKSE